ncbi:unnamed protein product, partial [Dibothriocephalus latus]
MVSNRQIAIKYTTVEELTASQVNDTTIIVSWTKPRPVDKFKDEYHVTIWGPDYKKTYTTKETWIIAGGLDTSKVDNVTVQGVWANGTDVPKVATTPIRKPSAGVPVVPKDFTASVINCTTIHLTWKAPNISQPWGRQYQLTVTNRTFTKSYKLQNTEETITNLVPASTYNFTLQALDQSGKPFRAEALIPVQMPAC